MVDQSFNDEKMFSTLFSGEPTDLFAALNVAGVGLMVLDLKTEQLHLSQSFSALLGVDAEETLNQLVARDQLMHADDHPIAEEALRALLEDGKPYQTLVRLRHGSGEYKYCSTKAKLFLDANGTPEKLVGIVQDVDALQRAKEDFRMAESMAKIGNWRRELLSDKFNWSDGTYKIFGYDPKSVDLNLDWVRQHYLPEDLLLVAAAHERGLKSREPYEVRARVVTKSGETRHTKLFGRVEIGTDDKPIALYGTVQDITEEVQREEILRQSQKLEAIGTLAGGVAHDFNNHLAVILGNLELLQDQINNPDVSQFVDTAISAALSGAALTRNLLSFARRAPLAPKPVDLNKIVRDLNKWTQRTLPATIETEVSLQAGLWTTEADEASAKSALLNLILNAQDAMPQGGKLTIETSNMRVDDNYIHTRDEDMEPGRYAVLSVSDTGCGIAPDMLELIFDPFFTTKEAGKGTGLGLSMVMGFMKQSGGTLRVYSEPGIGTTFNAFFKAKEAPTEVAQYRTQELSKVQRNSIRLLVAEDNEEVGAMLQTSLLAAGFRVTLAISGDAAKAVFEADRGFDLLITDIVMPGRLQGPLLARELREINRDLPVVFLSGYANEAKVHGNGLRPEDIRLMKPVRMAELVATVEQALRSNRKS